MAEYVRGLRNQLSRAITYNGRGSRQMKVFMDNRCRLVQMMPKKGKYVPYEPPEETISQTHIAPSQPHIAPYTGITLDGYALGTDFKQNHGALLLNPEIVPGSHVNRNLDNAEEFDMQVHEENKNYDFRVEIEVNMMPTSTTRKKHIVYGYNNPTGFLISHLQGSVNFS